MPSGYQSWVLAQCPALACDEPPAQEGRGGQEGREDRDESYYRGVRGEEGQGRETVGDRRASDLASGRAAIDRVPLGVGGQRAYGQTLVHAEGDQEEHGGRMVCGRLVWDRQDHLGRIRGGSLDFGDVVNVEDREARATWSRPRCLVGSWLGCWRMGWGVRTETGQGGIWIVASRGSEGEGHWDSGQADLELRANDCR